MICFSQNKTNFNKKKMKINFTKKTKFQKTTKITNFTDFSGAFLFLLQLKLNDSVGKVNTRERKNYKRNVK